MADLSSLKLQKMQLNLRLQQIELSKFTQSVRVAELEHEISRISENFVLYENEMTQVREQIKDLEKSEKELLNKDLLLDKGDK